MGIPDTVIPRSAVNELLRIGDEPLGVARTDSTISFILDNDSWVHTSLIDAKWPDIEPFFSHMEDLPPIPDNLLEAVQAVAPFCPDAKLPRIYFGKNGVSTHDGEMNSEYSIDALPEGCFHAEVLLKVLPSVEYIDLARYPKHCPFTGCGGLLGGVLVGLVT
ncbi:MAG: hypothetical protein DRI65_13855 [Chloroflexota bacterium]|nr:MAG: hypothetical protein DRI65_13855 [Chloroflexota bacterium]